jgi:hypothetical protein
MGNARRLAPDAEFLSLYQKISPPLTVQAVSIEILALVLTGNLCVAVTLKEAMLSPLMETYKPGPWYVSVASTTSHLFPQQALRVKGLCGGARWAGKRMATMSPYLASGRRCAHPHEPESRRRADSSVEDKSFCPYVCCRTDIEPETAQPYQPILNAELFETLRYIMRFAAALLLLLSPTERPIDSEPFSLAIWLPQAE